MPGKGKGTDHVEIVAGDVVTIDDAYAKEHLEPHGLIEDPGAANEREATAHEEEATHHEKEAQVKKEKAKSLKAKSEPESAQEKSFKKAKPTGGRPRKSPAKAAAKSKRAAKSKAAL